MKYEEGERDLVMLQHKFVVEWADGTEVSPFGGVKTTVADNVQQANADVDARAVRKPGWSLRDGGYCGCSVWHCYPARVGWCGQYPGCFRAVHQRDLRAYSSSVGEGRSGFGRESFVMCTCEMSCSIGTSLDFNGDFIVLQL